MKYALFGIIQTRCLGKNLSPQVIFNYPLTTSGIHGNHSRPLVIYVELHPSMKNLLICWSLIALTSLFLFPMLAQGQSSMQQGKISVISLEGDAWQVSGNQKERLRSGAVLSSGTNIVTGPNGVVSLLFENGSTINIRPGSKFSIDQFLVDPFDTANVDFKNLKAEPSTSITQVTLTEGMIVNNVRKLNRKGSVYNIVTPVGTAGIRGTITYANMPRVGDQSFGVPEGSVQFTTTAGQTRTIANGAATGFSDGGFATAPSDSASLGQAATAAVAAMTKSTPSGNAFSEAAATSSDSSGDEADQDASEGEDSGSTDGAGGAGGVNLPSLGGGGGGGGGGSTSN